MALVCLFSKRGRGDFEENDARRYVANSWTTTVRLRTLLRNGLDGLTISKGRVAGMRIANNRSPAQGRDRFVAASR
jgi:hypothetical protein